MDTMNFVVEQVDEAQTLEEREPQLTTFERIKNIPIGQYLQLLHEQLPDRRGRGLHGKFDFVPNSESHHTIWKREAGGGTYCIGEPEAPLIFHPNRCEPGSRGYADEFRELSVWRLQEMTKTPFPEGLWSADGRQVVRSNFTSNYEVVVDRVHGVVFPAQRTALHFWSFAQEPKCVWDYRWSSDPETPCLRERVIEVESVRKAAALMRKQLQPLYDYCRTLCLVADDPRRASAIPGKALADFSGDPKDFVDGLCDNPIRGAWAIASYLNYNENPATSEISGDRINQLLDLRHGMWHDHEKLYLFDPTTKHIGGAVRKSKV